MDFNVKFCIEVCIFFQFKKLDEVFGQVILWMYMLDVVLYGFMKYVKNIGIYFMRYGFRLIVFVMV